MADGSSVATELPRALTSYPSGPDQTLAATLAERVRIEPFNAIATAIFVLAIIHTFSAARFMALAHHVQKRHTAPGARAGPRALAKHRRRDAALRGRG